MAITQIQTYEQAESDVTSTNKISFMDMQLKVGHKLHLKLFSRLRTPVGIKCNSCAATLIGYVQDSTLIVTMPTFDQSTGDLFVEDDQVQISLYSGKSVFSFIVFVDKVIRAPFKYLHLSFPKKIQSKDIRKSRRITCRIQGSIVEKSIPVFIINLSVCGAGISSNLPLGALGTTITLSFTLTILDKEIPLSIKSTLRSSTSQVNKNGPEIICYGVEFAHIEPEQMHTIRHLIYQEIVERPENAA